jgi:hypothetical protein
MSTNDTSGPLFTASSPSARLQWSLASRLQARMAGNGSPLFALTWRQQDMPSGPPICQLAASARRTSGSDCGSWPTPRALEGQGSPIATLETALREIKRRGTGSMLDATVHLASWPTPTRQDAASSGAAGYLTESGRHSGTTLTDAARASWATPSARDFKSNECSEAFHQARAEQTRGKPLSEQVHRLASWATPRANKWGEPDSHGKTAFGSPAPTEKRGQLNPDFTRWLMGYSAGHLSCAPTAMPSSPRRQKRS